ncbi:MAG: BON domain-containing protein [Gammaproteobacteria bacterium]|nr:BON domain-containing protein [Gammaproteobacteria bacterium]
MSTLLVLAALLPLAGCRNYLASEEGRTVGEVTDDSAIHARVKGGLVLARGVPGWPIDVDVREGVVVLTGQVATEAQRTRAIGIARGVPGVKDVQDRLVVVGAAEPTPEAAPETAPQ